MPVPFVVPAYMALLALIYVFLGLRVSRIRYGSRIPLGSGGNARLERAIRAHANFSEFVPLALLLLMSLEMQRTSLYVLHVLCLVLVFGRLVHAYGISQENEVIALRSIGTIATQAVLVVASVILLHDFSLFLSL